MNLLIGLSIVGICLLLLKRNYTKREAVEQRSKDYKVTSGYDFEKMEKLFFELRAQGRQQEFHQMYPHVWWDAHWKQFRFYTDIEGMEAYDDYHDNEPAYLWPLFKLWLQRVLLCIAIIIGCIFIFLSFLNF